MCLAIPGKIESLFQHEDGMKMAKVSFGGTIKEICVDWIDDPDIGDYLLVHVGFALNKIDQKDALETLQILREMGELPEDGTDEIS